jgi:hypothetical protein
MLHEFLAGNRSELMRRRAQGAARRRVSYVGYRTDALVAHVPVCGMSNGLFAESFRRAAARLGGVDELAIYLQTPVENVERWVRGTTRPPVSAFLRVVDIITSRDASANGR